MKKNKIFICHVPTSQILVHLQLCHVGCQLVQVGQLHVVAIDVAQVGIGIGRHRKFVSLELVSGEREDFIFEARVVVGDAHARGDDLVGQQATRTRRKGKRNWSLKSKMRRTCLMLLVSSVLVRQILYMCPTVFSVSLCNPMGCFSIGKMSI